MNLPAEPLRESELQLLGSACRNSDSLGLLHRDGIHQRTGASWFELQAKRDAYDDLCTPNTPTRNILRATPTQNPIAVSCVLVQLEMECGRSPLVSIARVSAGRGAADRNGDRHEEEGTEAATGLKRRSVWATIVNLVSATAPELVLCDVSPQAGRL